MLVHLDLRLLHFIVDLFVFFCCCSYFCCYYCEIVAPCIVYFNLFQFISYFGICFENFSKLPFAFSITSDPSSSSSSSSSFSSSSSSFPLYKRFSFSFSSFCVLLLPLSPSFLFLCFVVCVQLK